MQSLTIPHTIALLQHVAITHREPVFLWGQPGVGKSDAIRQLARITDAVLVDVRMSQYDSVDLRGIPVADDQTGLTRWHPPSTLPFTSNPQFETERLIVLFLDEMNSAAASVQAVGYQLINDRAVGEHALRDNVVVIAAGNRETDRGVTTRMPTPLANRFTHVEVSVDVDAWCSWAQSVGIDPVSIAFLQFRKGLLSTFDPSKTDKAFATPRSWAKAFRYYADTSMPEHIKMAAMDGAVGPGPAAEFWGFVDVWRKMPSIPNILKNPTTAGVPEELSMRYAVAVALASQADSKTIGAVNTYLQRFQQDEFLLLTWKLAVDRNQRLMSTPEFMQMAHLLKRVFT